MGAVYPANLKNFVPHTNNGTERIDASHVNAAQDEIAAIQATLGTSPQIDPTLNGVSNDFKTVRARMEALHRGATIPVCQVERSTKQNIPNNVTAGTYFTFSSPAKVDPFSMWGGGTTITIPRTGWWTITADVLYDPNANGKHRMMKIFVSTDEVTGQDAPPGDATWGARRSCSWSGRIAAGYKVQLWAYQDSGISLGTLASLGLTFSRDL